MTKAKPKRGGRPKTRQPRPGERVHLGLRVSPELKRRLERAAEQSTRSLSQEVEFRLEQSFQSERFLEDVRKVIEVQLGTTDAPDKPHFGANKESKK